MRSTEAVAPGNRFRSGCPSSSPYLPPLLLLPLEKWRRKQKCGGGAELEHWSVGEAHQEQRLRHQWARGQHWAHCLRRSWTGPGLTSLGWWRKERKTCLVLIILSYICATLVCKLWQCHRIHLILPLRNTAVFSLSTSPSWTTNAETREEQGYWWWRERIK